MKKILVFVMALALTLMSVMPVAAEKYDGSTPIKEATGTTTTFDKYLVMDKEAQVPYADFLYTVSSDGATGAPASNEANEEIYPAVLIPATDDTPKDKNPVVWRGVRPDKVKVSTTTETTAKVVKNKLTFMPTDATTDGQFRANKGDIANGREKYVKKEITLNFSDIKFAEPGVYRYYLNESNGTAADSCIYDDLGIAYDVNAADANKNWRTVDVYVLDDESGNLYISDYVWYEGKLTASQQPSHSADKTIAESPWSVEWTDATDTNKKYAYDKNDEWKVMVYDSTDSQWKDSGDIVKEPPATATGSVTIDGKTYATWGTAKAAMPEDESKIKNPNGAEASTPKSSEFVNKYGTADLEFGKKVEGNQGSRDQWFQFKVTLENSKLPDGTMFEMNVASYTSSNPANAAHFFAPTDNSATSYTAANMTTANTVNNTYFLGDPVTPATNPVTYDHTFKAANNGTTSTNFLISKDGKVQWPLYLQHGQYIQIKGIPYGVEYKVEETDLATGYTKKEGTDVEPGVIDGEEITNQHKDPTTGEIGKTKTVKTYMKHALGDLYKDGNTYKQLYIDASNNKAYTDQAKTQEWTGDRWFDDDNIYTGWTNKRSGVIPTGLLMSAAGGIALVLIALTLLTLMRRRRLAEED